ncbi:M16 family metallopeptidase [Litorisediminicola beolgyonensis]|uniref:M16 family metallopeptidase n=1 Tax=Litorisediminicola beolgyonensis TaxID=1173614 RepID=A0ABW3ZCK5_9RHOB
MTRLFSLTALIGAALIAALPARAAVDIEVIETQAGHTAWLVEEPSIPFLALELRFQGGASLDLPGKRGATNLMTGLLNEGAGDLDAQGFAAAEESLAASFGFDVGDDALSVSARFLTENRDEAVALLKSALTEPRFDADAIERVRQQVLSGIRRDSTDPDAIASREWSALIFEGHPYGTSSDGTEDSVAALTRDDLVTAWQNAIAQDRVFIGASGDISAEELATLIDDLLADLPVEGAPQPEDVAVDTTSGTTIVEFDTPQSVALFGHSGIDRHDDDFFPAFVLNHILGGGGFESKLMNEVREKRGLTYGVYSYLANRDHADLLMGRVASANDRIAEAVSVIRDIWAEVAANGVSEEDLEQAKTYLTGAYPLRFSSNSNIANILVGMQMDDLPPDYVNTRNDKVDAVTAQDVARVAARLMQPHALRFLVVGKPEGLVDG